ncbi:unnamed protein product [Victoria cruziana]
MMSSSRGDRAAFFLKLTACNSDVVSSSNQSMLYFEILSCEEAMLTGYGRCQLSPAATSNFLLTAVPLLCQDAVAFLLPWGRSPSTAIDVADVRPSK